MQVAFSPSIEFNYQHRSQFVAVSSVSQMSASSALQ